jgi:hypothetical protein
MSGFQKRLEHMELDKPGPEHGIGQLMNKYFMAKPTMQNNYG